MSLTFYPTRLQVEKDAIVENYVLFACDKNEDGRIKFGKKSIDEIETFIKVLNENKNIYEILPPSLPVKPYFDLEIEKPDFEFDDMKGLLEKFILFLINEFKIVFSINITKNEFMILDSCRENKLSYHIIINSSICFNSVLEHKEFIIYLNKRFNKPTNNLEKELFESLTYTIKQEQRFIFDTRPYGRYQNIRCINQSKIKKDYILKNITTQFTVKDSLIRLYDNASKSSYKNINIEGLNNMEIIKQKKSKNKSNSEPKVETDNINFQVEGMTILIKKEITFESLNKLPLYLQYLYLIPNTSQNVTIFTNIGMALKTCGGSIIDYVEFAKLSPKYGGSNSKIHYKFSKFRNKEETEKLNARSYGFNYLKTLAKLANPEYFKSCNQCLMAYFSLNIDNIKVIKETSQFVSQVGTTDENNILTESKLIVLHAYLGRGKTTSIKRILP